MSKATIKVQGKGAIHVVPDVTRVEVTIEQWFANHSAAYAQAKENSSWMVKILEFNKKPGKLAKTVRFDIEDYTENLYDDDDNYIGKKKNGFMLDQRIKIDLPVDNVLVNNIVKGVGKFIPNAQIKIGYTLQDERPSQMKMLARAVSDARDKAQVMAEAVGCKVGKVLDVEYGYSNVHVYSQARNIHSNSEAKASTASSLDITPEDLVMSDTAQVTFELINP
ncbi:MAG: SIMPL domain-containing protein [Muribaculaceae bacterium]|nr:SIMPL domain-containing protein [Muribaculaceae bacterium]